MDFVIMIKNLEIKRICLYIRLKYIYNFEWKDKYNLNEKLGKLLILLFINIGNFLYYIF